MFSRALARALSRASVAPKAEAWTTLSAKIEQATNRQFRMTKCMTDLRQENGLMEAKFLFRFSSFFPTLCHSWIFAGSGSF
jgi:hypothetical protein